MAKGCDLDNRINNEKKEHTFSGGEGVQVGDGSWMRNGVGLHDKSTGGEVPVIHCLGIGMCGMEMEAVSV